VVISVREPFAWDALLAFYAMRAVPGVEEVADGAYRRSLRLPHGWGRAELARAPGGVRCRLELADARDREAALAICRRLIDAEADPVAIDARLGAAPPLAPLVSRRPGIRVPGTADGGELAVRALLGQQVSVAAARTIAGRMVAAAGDSLPAGTAGVTHLWPRPEAIAALAPELPMPHARRRAVAGVAAALAARELTLEPGADPAPLLELRGVGPWTAGYVAMRALGDRDAWLPTDLGVRHALERLGAADPDAWRPFRAYAVQHLWAGLGDSAVPYPGPRGSRLDRAP
jgi:AraC family transcriptional regulator of adaptative response / DNA-3-methyladenine glycosylase II